MDNRSVLVVEDEIKILDVVKSFLDGNKIVTSLGERNESDENNPDCRR